MRAVVILDGRAPHAVLLELFTAHGAGTLIRAPTRGPERRWRSRRGRGGGGGAQGLAVLGGVASRTRATARRRRRRRWCCSGRTARASGPRFQASRGVRRRRGRPARPLVAAGDRRAGAARSAATALFPFGGPPWLPFPAWARRTGRAWDSPVGLLVQRRPGLFVSYRGALALPRAAGAAAGGGAALRRLRAALPRRLPGGRARRGRLRRAGLPRLSRHRGRAATASRGAARSGAPARSGRGCGRGAVGLPHGGVSCQSEAHDAADPDPPRQVELGRGRPARPRPPAERGAGGGDAAAMGAWLAAQRLCPGGGAGARRRGGRRRPGRCSAAEFAAAEMTPRPELYHARPGRDAGGAPAGAGRRRRVLLLGHQPGIGAAARLLLAAAPADPEFAQVSDGGDRGDRVRGRRLGRRRPGAQAGSTRSRRPRRCAERGPRRWPSRRPDPQSRGISARGSGSGTAWSARTAGC